MYNNQCLPTTQTRYEWNEPFYSRNKKSHSSCFLLYGVNECHTLSQPNIITKILNSKRYIYIPSDSITPTKLEQRTEYCFRKLETSFLRHHGTKDGRIWEAFKEMANLICRWNFRESFVQVNRKTQSLKFSLVMDNNVTLNVTKYFEEDEHFVFFSLFHEKELLVSDCSTMTELSKKIMLIEKADNE